MGDYTPKGQGNLNTVLGAIGTAGVMGVFNGGCGDNGGGINLFNNNKNNCYVTQREQHYIEMANAEARRAEKLEAEKYSDTNDITLYKEITAEAKAESNRLGDLIRTLNDEAVRNREEISVLKADIRCLAVTNEKDHTALYNYVDNGLKLEAERRACGDQNLYNYVNATFVPGELNMPLDKICPQAMPKCPDTTQVELVSKALIEALIASGKLK